MFLGTPNYAAPEQIQGQKVDGRADQYALACMAFELLAGEAPFERDDHMAVIWAQVTQAPPLLSSRRPGLPVAADRVLTRALAKVQEDRYGSCREFADALREAVGLLPYESDAPIAGHGRPPTVVVPGLRAAGDRIGEASTIGREHALAPRSTRPPLPATAAKLQRGGAARIRIAGSAGFSLLLLSLAVLNALVAVPNAFGFAYSFPAIAGLAAVMLGAVISFLERRRGWRLESLVHGFNSIGLVLAVAGGILASIALGAPAPSWLGYAAFLPLALGNIICSVRARAEVRKLNQTGIDRKLSLTLAATTGCVAIGDIFFAILNSQPDFGSSFAYEIARIAAGAFLLAFLISCRALRIVSSHRRLG